MKRLLLILAVALSTAACLPPASQAAHPSQGNFGLHGFDVTYTEADGTMPMRAGSHPFAYTTSFDTNVDGEGVLEGWPRDLFFAQAPGLIGDTTAYPRCTALQFLEEKPNTNGESNCPLPSVVGIVALRFNGGDWGSLPVYTIEPPFGTLLRLGFNIGRAKVMIDVTLSKDPPYNAIAVSHNTSQLVEVRGSRLQLWGNPSADAHDSLRGPCGNAAANLLPSGEVEFKGNGKTCPVEPNPRPFLTLPTTCAEPLLSSYQAFSWEGESALDDGFDAGAVLSHDEAGLPAAFADCDGLAPFSPSITAKPTTKAAQSPTGLDFTLDVSDEGLTSVGGRSQSDIRKAVVTLPEGMSVNPSQAEGLAVCSEADLQRETLDAEPGEGCPEASKIGTVEVESPLIEEPVKGALFVAEPYHNLAGNSLLAVYLVFRSPKLGIIVKQPLRIESDPVTGRLTTVADEIPQLAFSHFRLHFREGTRSPLVSPPSCGAHQVKAVLYPWSGGPPAESTSSFEIVSGPDNSPCPSGGLPPFHPGLIAGSINNAAGHFSPFNVRLFRSDSEQEITHFSIKLPPGVVGKLAGIPFCPDAAIALAQAKTGPLGGHEELQHPSCPAASEVGHTLVGSGVGPSLAYAPGRLYLAGPYHGSAISLVAITAGVVGPFDIGTVVVREALRVNPETAEVFIDATGSDPIPHIIKGIPVHLRDIRVYTDRPEFVLNPTSCERTSTASTVLGAGLDFVSEADDNPLVVSTPFQAADCAALPFAPKLSLKLIGGTNRGAHPKLLASLKMNGFGEAGIARAQVTLPHSEFIENEHFNTICTRVQFKEGGGNGERCPAGSIYGHARAVTPILTEPLEGPVFLRSSEHQLPDVVAALHSAEINVDLVGRVDSVKGGGIRTTFETVPDAPVSSATFVFLGAAKGLFVNSTDLCRSVHRAKADFTGHNGKAYDTKPALGVKCPKGRKGHKRHRRHKRAG